MFYKTKQENLQGVNEVSPQQMYVVDTGMAMSRSTVLQPHESSKTLGEVQGDDKTFLESEFKY